MRGTRLSLTPLQHLSIANVSKDDRHVLRLAAVLHVVYDQLTKMLRGEDEPSPPSGEISLITLEQSIALCNYFTKQRRILDQVS